MTPNNIPVDFDELKQAQGVGIQGGLLQHSVSSFVPKALFLSRTQHRTHRESLHFLNNYLQTPNRISSLNFSKVDLCLVDSWSFLDIAGCQQMFGIPTVITMVPALISKAEYTELWPSSLYLNDPFALDFYVELQYGSVMTWRQKWSNVVANALHLVTQKVRYY